MKLFDFLHPSAIDFTGEVNCTFEILLCRGACPFGRPIVYYWTLYWTCFSSASKPAQIASKSFFEPT